MAKKSEVRKIEIRTGYERNVVLNFQTWKFPVYYTETVEIENDVELSYYRKQLRLRAVGAVYSDILNDFDRILHAMPQQRTDLLALCEELRKEATSAITDVQTQLNEMEKKKVEVK